MHRVIASDSERSRAACVEHGLPRRFALLAMTVDDQSRFPLHRRLQTRLRRTRLQRLLLALMRRPAGQPDHVEGRADAAIRIGKAFAVDLRHPQHGGAAGRRSPPFDQNIGRAHPPEIGHQRERAVVAHHDAIDVGDRQRKPGALQQRADIAQIRERRDARRYPALAFGFRRGKGLPQLGQRIAADHRRQQQPVRLQRAADLRQHAGQIVDELERERRDGEIERFRLQRQRFGWVEIDAPDRLEAIRDRLSQQFARRPDIGDIGKIPHHRLQPLFHILPDAIEQERRRSRHAARVPSARAAMRGRTGWVRRSGSKPCRLVRRLALSLAIPCLSPLSTGASLVPWTPRHHHHAPSPVICVARSSACRDALAHLPKLALDIALPTLCVSCREPVDGEGVCAACWAKLSFIEPPYLSAARHSLCLRSRSGIAVDGGDRQPTGLPARPRRGAL